MLRIASITALAVFAAGLATPACLAQTLDSGSGLYASQKVNTPPAPRHPSTPVVTNPAAGGAPTNAAGLRTSPKHSCAARKGSAVSMNRADCRP